MTSSSMSRRPRKLLSFPHTLLYSEPPRLRGLGLVTETVRGPRSTSTVFAITPAGTSALGASARIDHPATPTDFADAGLLQLFFADLASNDAKRAQLAERRFAIHEAKLAACREADRYERRADRPQRGQRTVEHWRGGSPPDRGPAGARSAAVEILDGSRPKAGVAARTTRGHD